MRLSEFKSHLQSVDKLLFHVSDGLPVPEHFHVTEIGVVTRHFIDCGGTERIERALSFQLWSATDDDHRLAPQKLAGIIKLAERKLAIGDDMEIEVEYQADTIGRYSLDFIAGEFRLTAKQTACRATDACGVAATPVQQSSNSAVTACCSPGGGCC